MSPARTARVLAATLLALGGCTIAPSGPALEAPKADRIYVFFPAGNQVTEGLVSGRGFPGAIPERATHVQISSYSTGFEAVVPVNDDGSFEFRVVAISGNFLEFRAATSASAEEVGAPTFIEVPATVLPRPKWLCCADTRTCQDEFERENNDPCPSPAPGVRSCMVDADCAVFENQYLVFPEGSVQITPPSAEGAVTIEGQVEPNLLVYLSNLGKSAVGTGLDEEERKLRGFENPGVNRTQISDEDGRFLFAGVPAVADDEIVIQLEDLNGYTSPAYALLVPDPPLAGVDVLGVFPWQPLTNGAMGRVAVRISPYGADGRGICPNAPEAQDGLELCVSGGLTHDMVELTRAQLDRPDDVAFALAPQPATLTEGLPHNRGIEGNVRSEALDLFVVVDMSAAAARDDPNGLVFDALRSYVRYLRARDRVGIVTFGTGNVLLQQGLSADRDGVLRTVDALAGQPRSGETALMAAVQLAAEELRSRRERRPGRVAVITFDPPDGTPEIARAALDQVLDLVEPNPLEAFDGFPVDVAYVDPKGTAPTLLELDDLSDFTRGLGITVQNINSLEDALADLRGDQVGSFILLYDMMIPADVGKAGTVFLDLRVTLPGANGSRETSYRGPLRIANAPNP